MIREYIQLAVSCDGCGERPSEQVCPSHIKTTSRVRAALKRAGWKLRLGSGIATDICSACTAKGIK